MTVNVKRVPKQPGPAQVVKEIAPDKPITSGWSGLSATEIRRIRQQVKYTTGLLSTQGPIRERQGNYWAADHEERIIYWRPFTSAPPHKPLTAEEILFLIWHEAGHLNWTGGYELPHGWSMQKKTAFHTFLNGPEDIRIERLQLREFPGAEMIREKTNNRFMDAHEEVQNWAVYHQVARHWLCRENNGKPKGTPQVIEFADKLWPDVTKICNADSTSELAKGIIPIFEKLWQVMEEEAQDPDMQGQPAGSSMGSGDPDDEGEGGSPANDLQGCGDGYPDELTNNQYKSPLGEHQKPLTAKEMIQELAKGAKGRAKQILEGILREAEQGEMEAERAKFIGVGEEPGDEMGRNPPPDKSWDRVAGEIKPQINALARRFSTVLQTNSANNWQEGMRRGRLNTNRSRRAVAGNNAIFRRRLQIGARDYVFGILPDVSGSMSDPDSAGGKKRDGLIQASVLLGESLERSGMHWFMIPWETWLRPRKGIMEKLNQYKKDELGAILWEPDGGTYEAPALIAALEEFAKYQSGHKVLIVISDGQTSKVEESEEIINDLTRSGVATIAVGVGIPAPQHYGIQVQVDTAKELNDILPRLINETLHKGGGSR